MNNFKNIHIGKMLKQRVAESGIEISRICNFMKCSEEQIEQMYDLKSLDTDILMRWSKLLEYDFFRIYTQHLILYAPPGSLNSETQKKINHTSALPQFKKNIYTPEIIEFILEQLKTNTKSKKQIIREYRIPKTTLYKWINKYAQNENIHNRSL